MKDSTRRSQENSCGALRQLAREELLLLGQSVSLALEPSRGQVRPSLRLSLQGQPMRVVLHPLLKQVDEFRRMSLMDLRHRLEMIRERSNAISIIEKEIQQTDSHKPVIALQRQQEAISADYQNLLSTLSQLVIEINKPETTASGIVNKRIINNNNMTGKQISPAAQVRSAHRSSVRALIDQVCPTAPQLDALALDHFTRAYHQFAASMDRTTRINLILSHYEGSQVIAAIKGRHGSN